MDQFPMEEPKSLAELDARIATVEILLADLKEKRNQMVAPLCRLPDELLTRTLLYLRDAWIRDDKYGSLDWRSWVRQLAVCWRIWGVAVQSPELWTFISLGFDDFQRSVIWTDLCLERSKAASLTLHMHLHPPAEVFSIVEQLAPRTRELRLHNNSRLDNGDDQTPAQENEDLYELLLSQEWKALESAEIDDFYAREGGVVNHQFLCGSSATLTTLHLKGVLWKIGECPDFPYLRDLKIHGFDSESRCILLKWLSSAQQLVHLDLETWRERDTAMRPITDKPGIKIKLDYLRYLRLEGHPDELLYLLSALPYPEEELSIHSHVRYGFTNTATVNDQTQLIAIAMSYWDRRIRSIPSVCGYRFSLSTQGHFHYYPRFVFEPMGDREPGPRRHLIFTGSRANDQIIRTFVSLSSVIIFETPELWDEAKIVMSSSHASLFQLSFRERTRGLQKKYWQTPQMLQDLGQQLQVMKERGHPLRTLTLTVKAPGKYLDDIELSWIEAGLIKELIREHENS